MTGDSRWFSSLTRASGNELITFGDASTGTVTAKGKVRVNNKFMLKDVALVSKLRYNLLSVSQLLGEGLEATRHLGLEVEEILKSALKILSSLEIPKTCSQ